MRCWNFVLGQVVTVTRLQHAEIKDSPFCYTCAARGQLKSQSGRKFYSSAALTTAQVYNPNTCNSQEYIKHQKYKQIWHGMKSKKKKKQRLYCNITSVAQNVKVTMSNFTMEYLCYIYKIKEPVLAYIIPPMDLGEG